MNYTQNSYRSSLPQLTGCRFSVVFSWVQRPQSSYGQVFLPNLWSLAELTGCCNWNSITVYIQLINCVYIIVYYPINNPLIDVVFVLFFLTMPNICENSVYSILTILTIVLPNWNFSEAPLKASKDFFQSLRKRHGRSPPQPRAMEP